MVDPKRIRRVSEREVGNGPVVYWMNRELRLDDNWALLFAKEKADECREPLIVVYNLVVNYERGGYRQWIFKLGVLQEIERECRAKNMAFFLLVSETEEKSGDDLLKFLENKKPGIVVTDFSPVRTQMSWVKKIGKEGTFLLLMVDAHNIVPAWEASDKQEYGAYTLRPKLFRLLPEYLTAFPKLTRVTESFSGRVPQIDWTTLLHQQAVDTGVTETLFPVGEKGAKKILKQFLDSRLFAYGTNRNDALADGQSDLSPYLHYGIIAPQRVALAVLEKIGISISEVIDERKNKAKVDEGKVLTALDHAGAFLEEMIIRRELSDNFCLYNKNYDQVEGFPDWAKKSHEKERSTKREFLYTKKEFEEAVTHDELWNAAEREMVTTGKMHGYMRMYWAKKILEWTKSPEEAMALAVYLNDKYSLDGRDPNGYAGIAWSIGGVHDRAWFPRPIYGTVRYMARSGCEKKFDVKAYIAKFSPKE